MRPVYSLIVLFLLGGAVAAAEQLEQVQHLQDSTVAIWKNSRIVGTAFVVDVGEGYVVALTAAHVVDHIEIAAPPSKDKKVKDAPKSIWTAVPVSGVTKLDRRGFARVIVYDEEEDLALLLILTPDKFPHGLKLAEAKKPKLGEEVWHCGNPKGLMWGSVSKGIVSFAVRGSRTENGVQTFTQFTSTTMSGCSGGPVVRLGDKEPEVIGIMTRFLRTPCVDDKGKQMTVFSNTENMGLAVPMTRIATWAKKHKIGWLVGDGKPPKVEELNKMQPREGAAFLPMVMMTK